MADDRDGSGLAAAQSFRDSRIVAFDNRRSGPVAASNAGVARARRPYLAFLDDDDWWQDRGHLSRAAQRIGAGAEFWFADGEMVMEHEGRQRLPFAFTADAESLERDNTILVSAIAYPPELHDSSGEFDEELGHYWIGTGISEWRAPGPAAARARRVGGDPHPCGQHVQRGRERRAAARPRPLRRQASAGTPRTEEHAFIAAEAVS